mmetsp:Transcript_30877/g.34573  ORF Transcript_30877/g.34573 Transcript_30877/m.34573 type:complete len:126 (-) Transcript_30877:156-533(-)
MGEVFMLSTVTTFASTAVSLFLVILWIAANLQSGLSFDGDLLDDNFQYDSHNTHEYKRFHAIIDMMTFLSSSLSSVLLLVWLSYYICLLYTYYIAHFGRLIPGDVLITNLVVRSTTHCLKKTIFG